MQFIDQSAAYTQKSITLAQAVAAGRARVSAPEGAEKLAMCFRPELKVAIAFDLDIDERLDFNTLPAGEKLDLFAAELLPKFFHPDLIPITGRSEWHVRFVVDGSETRLLRMDGRGLHDVSHQDRGADIEIETDMVTLLAMLRSVIAEFHHRKPPYPRLPAGAGEEPDDEVWGN